MSDRRASTWRNVASSLLLATGSLVCTLGLLEFATRTFGVSVETVYINRKTIELDPNPRLQYRLKANSVARAEVEYRINSLGFRGPETTLIKPPTASRIVVSGDSIAFGYWVASKDAFAQQLATLANATRTTRNEIEVINLGVPGFNLTQDFELLQMRGLQYDPDLVIISVCLNDLESIFSYEYGLTALNAKQRNNPNRWTRLRNLAVDYSMFAAFLEYRFSQLPRRMPRSSAAARSPNDPGSIGLLAARRADQSKKLLQTFQTFERLLRLNRNIPSLVVLFPGLDYDYSAYPHGVFHKLVADAAAQSGLPFLDILGCYRGYPVRDLAVDPVHPNPLGHRIAAHAILDAIDANSLLPASDFDLNRIGSCSGYRAEDFPMVRGPKWAFSSPHRGG
jgi:lysophospholipase L1-like esterase